MWLTLLPYVHIHWYSSLLSTGFSLSTTFFAVCDVMNFSLVVVAFLRCYRKVIQPLCLIGFTLLSSLHLNFCVKLYLLHANFLIHPLIYNSSYYFSHFKPCTHPVGCFWSWGDHHQRVPNYLVKLFCRSLFLTTKILQLMLGLL